MIRLQRVGRRNQSSFRIILTPKRSGPKGKPVEFLGSWDPRLDKANLKQERISYWISKGAKVSPTVHNLLVSGRVISEKKIPVHKIRRATPEIEASGSPIQTEPPRGEDRVAPIESQSAETSQEGVGDKAETS